MSNAQGIAFLSFGLIVSGGGSFPSVYDVRSGVDNGNGELGTLTSPIPANVRSGIQYGGDGTQYTGTLYVPSSSGGNTWPEEMLELWHEEAQMDEFYAQYSYGAGTYDCIKTPIQKRFNMTLNAYGDMADSIIDTLRSDCIASGLYDVMQANPQTKRPIVTVNNVTYDVLRIETDDATQPSIRLFIGKHQ